MSGNLHTTVLQLGHKSGGNKHCDVLRRSEVSSRNAGTVGLRTTLGGTDINCERIKEGSVAEVGT